MIRKSLCAVVVLCAVASVSNAALIGSFEQLATGKTTNGLVYPGEFDTWVFNVENQGEGNVEGFEFHFVGNFLNQGGTSSQQTPVNPLLFGIAEGPDTFFVTRPSIPNADILIAPGTLVETQTNFDVSYTVAGAPSLLDTGEKRAVVHFTVPTGTMLSDESFVSGSAAIAGELVAITLGGLPNTPPVGANALIDNVFAGDLINHPFQANDAETASNLLVWSNPVIVGAPAFGGTGVHALEPQLASDGTLTWNTLGSARGIYEITATVTDDGNPALSGTAVLTVNITAVPEPATFGLIGLALVGIVGLARRRS